MCWPKIDNLSTGHVAFKLEMFRKVHMLLLTMSNVFLNSTYIVYASESNCLISKVNHKHIISLTYMLRYTRNTRICKQCPCDSNATL